MYTCIIRETFVFTVFRRVFRSILKLELCRHACRRRDQIIPTCRYGKNMPTTALVSSHTLSISAIFSKQNRASSTKPVSKLNIVRKLNKLELSTCDISVA